MTTGRERPSWTDREEQLGAGFQDVACQSCATTVLVRKSSPEQTSVQWPAAAACPFLVWNESGTPSEGCPDLTRSIWDAFEAGRIPVGPQ